MENVSADTVSKERPLTAAFAAMQARMPVPVPNDNETEELRRQAANGEFRGFGSPPGKF